MASRLLFLVFITTACFIDKTTDAQRFKDVFQAEDTLHSILLKINLADNDSIKDILNLEFSKTMEEALVLPSADNHSFETLKTLAKITAPDNKFRIIQWNLPDSRGKHRYYGFLKVLGTNPGMVFKLKDQSDSLPYPDTILADPDHWFGALYYKVIAVENRRGEVVYTLLGWAGKDKTMTQKVIEVLTFDSMNNPGFGLKIFPDFEDGKRTRIVFRFGITSAMSMKYERQSIVTNKKWNKKKRVFDSVYEEAEMIVCDRMVPLDPQLEGQYRFYVAAGDIYDGFIFRDDYWHFISGINPRNEN